MQKTRRSNIVLVSIMIFSMIAMYGLNFLPGFITAVQAVGLASVKDTISTSGLSASTSHEIVIDIASSTMGLTTGEYVTYYFSTSTNFSAASIVQCPTNMTASTTGTNDTTRIFDCVATGYVSATTTATTTIYGLINPSVETSGTVTVTVNDSNGVEREQSQAAFYVLSTITVTATVNASLQFTVGEMGLDVGTTSVRGIDLTASSTSTTLPFGTLSASASTTIGHSLAVSTNASGGFIVTVEQDGELETPGGDNINSFNNSATGLGSTTAQAWAAPDGTVDIDRTYGHLGVASSDHTNTGGPTFTLANKYVGLNGTDPLQVMYHNGVANGTGDGLAYALYTIEISSLQEAGEYTSTLTYICTPTY